MAADTKRGATIKGLQFHAMHYGLGVDVDDLKSMLAAQGLHVVTDADKAVLDAWSAVPTETLWLWANHMSAHVCNTCRAELARREALRGR